MNAIAGYGVEAHFSMLSFDQAWAAFGLQNGFQDRHQFLSWGARNRNRDLHTIGTELLACTIILEAVFWPRERWIPWGIEQGWARTGIQQGKYEKDPARISRLLNEIGLDRLGVPEAEEFCDSFVPLEADECEIILAKSCARRGQGTFRSRLLTAYGSRCAITGEHTEPVLDAAHVQIYLGPRSNHIQNGLLLTKEFHALFDAGLVTVTPDFTIRVFNRIRDRWKNGHRYNPYNGRKLEVIPDAVSDHPSRAALEWHAKNVFERAG